MNLVADAVFFGLRRVVVVAVAAGALNAFAAPPLRAKVALDRQNAVYKIGETATFSVSIVNADDTPATNGVLQVALDDFGTNRVFRAFAHDLSQTNGFSVSGSLDAPGFLRLRLSGVPLEIPPGGWNEYSVWSAAFEPERIRSAVVDPADFDAYWEGERRRLAEEVPADVQLEACPEATTAEHYVFRVSAATFGNRRLHGWLGLPRNSSAPAPLAVQISAAGFGPWSQLPQLRAGVISMFLTVFPFQPDPRDHENRRGDFNAFEQSLRDRFGASYPHAGALVSREVYFYHDVLLGIDRLVDWAVAALPVDRARVACIGTSQGGGLSLMTLALNRNFTRGAVYVPALTDFSRVAHDGRRSGWPQFHENFPGWSAEASAAFERDVAPYFDAVNFARRVAVPIRFAVGFRDNTCPPHAVYSAFNACGSRQKSITCGVDMAHGVQDWIYRANDGWACGPADETDVNSEKPSHEKGK